MDYYFKVDVLSGAGCYNNVSCIDKFVIQAFIDILHDSLPNIFVNHIATDRKTEYLPKTESLNFLPLSIDRYDICFSSNVILGNYEKVTGEIRKRGIKKFSFFRIQSQIAPYDIETNFTNRAEPAQGVCRSVIDFPACNKREKTESFHLTNVQRRNIQRQCSNTAPTKINWSVEEKFVGNVPCS